MLKYLFPLSFFLFYIIFITLLIRAYRDRQGEFPSDKPYYLLIDMLLGGACIGEVDSLALPVEMKVGRVRYYRKD